MKNYDTDIISIDLTITSFMMIITTFFAGFLISNISQYDPTVKIAILFLIVSTFSNLYTSNIFGNASGEIMAGNQARATKHAAIGTLISEYLGTYLIAFSIPWAINSIIGDTFLSFATFLISATGLAAYSISTFSVLKRYIKRISARIIYVISVTGLSLICFVSQKIDYTVFVFLAFSLLFIMIATAVTFMFSKNHYKNI